MNGYKILAAHLTYGEMLTYIAAHPHFRLPLANEVKELPEELKKILVNKSVWIAGRGHDMCHPVSDTDGLVALAHNLFKQPVLLIATVDNLKPKRDKVENIILFGMALLIFILISLLISVLMTNSTISERITDENTTKFPTSFQLHSSTSNSYSS